MIGLLRGACAVIPLARMAIQGAELYRENSHLVHRKKNEAQNKEAKQILLETQKVDSILPCAGCGLRFVEGQEKLLAVSYNRPKKKGGSDEIHNKILLCGPCYYTKGTRMTLDELWAINRREGQMEDAHLATAAERNILQTHGGIYAR